MAVTTVLELPPFDTGQFEGSSFLISDGDATLSVRVAGLPTLTLSFHKVRWHQFTVLYNCTPEMVKDAYFRLVEYPNSPAVARYMREDQSSPKPYRSLSHYRIFPAETGCHEVYAESVAAL